MLDTCIQRIDTTFSFTVYKTIIILYYIKYAKQLGLL